MSNISPENKIKIVIISSQIRDLGLVAQFLNKRNFSVTLKNGLREGINYLSENRPDWLLLSLNLSPVIDKYTVFLKQSFNVEPILFADVLDRNSVSRLEQMKIPTIISRLTGPTIQLKLHQILANRNPETQADGRPLPPARASSGVRRSAFVHMKGESNNESFGSVRINMSTVPVPSHVHHSTSASLTTSPQAARAPTETASAPPPQNHLAHGHSSTPNPNYRSQTSASSPDSNTVTSGRGLGPGGSYVDPGLKVENPQTSFTPIETNLHGKFKTVTAMLTVNRPTSEIKPVNDVEQLNVMVWEEDGMSGYIVIGGSSSMTTIESSEEAHKFHQQMTRDKPQKSKEKLFGAIQVKIDNLPGWAEMRSRLVQRYTSTKGEMLSCFVPEPEPLPAMKPSPADAGKFEVRIQDIPTQVTLPCPIFIHLPQNGKYVCLIKAEGYLSNTQQERLVKMGAANLIIAKEDVQRFNLFYVREKLALGPPETKR